MRGGASNDGMLARFGLLVWPETGGTWKNVDRIPDGPAKAAAFGAFDQLEPPRLPWRPFGLSQAGVTARLASCR